MKYLKSYENLNNKEIKNSLLNYIIWATPRQPAQPNFYHIVEIINKIDNKAYINILYTYDIENKSLIKEDSSPYFKEYYIIQKSIVFQSNNLQECLNILPILNTINKFNL